MPLPFNYVAMTTLAANGQTAAIDLGINTVTEATVYLNANATWGSGTLILQQSFDGGTTYYTVPNFSKTSGSASTVLGRVPVIGGGLLRASLSGATSPSLGVCIKVEEVAAPLVKQFSLTANGSTTPFYFTPVANYPVTTQVEGDNLLVWAAQGTWGSGTLALQVSPDGGTTWFNQQAGITANGTQYAAGVSDTLCRFTLTGATSPSLTIYAV